MNRCIYIFCFHSFFLYFRFSIYFTSHYSFYFLSFFSFFFLFFLFSISYGWKWFYYLSPLSWAFKAISINEFSSPDYDYLVASAGGGTQRAGDDFLKSRGIETSIDWIWYGFAVIVGEYFLLVYLTGVVLEYIKTLPSPPVPVIIPYNDDGEAEFFEALSEKRRKSEKRRIAVLSAGGSLGSFNIASNKAEEMTFHEIPFEPIVFSFRDIWYTVSIPKKDDLDLLKGVNGYFEPGTVTALMGSSGAGNERMEYFCLRILLSFYLL